MSYKAGIIEAIQEHKDRTGSSSIAIKKIMQAKLATDKKWMNATFLAALKKGGTLSLAGIHMTPLPEMDYEKYIFYERDIHSVTANTRADGRELLAQAAEIPIRPHTTTYPLSEANRALMDLKNDRLEGTGVLVMQ